MGDRGPHDVDIESKGQLCFGFGYTWICTCYHIFVIGEIAVGLTFKECDQIMDKAK